MTKIIIGTRGSQLALWQANWVKSELENNNPDVTVELEVIKTKGDKILDVPLAQVGGKGLFVKEIEEALLDGRIDLAVHSMKDMPSELPPGLTIGAIPEREIANDVLFSKDGKTLSELPQGATVGTSSLRRSAQLRLLRPDIKIVPLRGNIDTRLKKLTNGEMDAIILAAAGVRRLQFDGTISEYIDKKVMIPAVGQGALCIETRENDPVIGKYVSALDDHETRVTVMAERAFLHTLEGSCQIPVAAHGKLEGGMVTLKGLVAEVDGSSKLAESISGPESDCERLGVELANKLLSMGADKILENLEEKANEIR